MQLYPLWRIGSRLPIVMGVSFTFVAVLSTVATNYGYPAVIGAVLIGGIFEGTIGLFAKYWRKIISPIVAASVVTAIGYSLFTVGARSFGGGYNDDFGSAENLILDVVTLAACLLWNIFAKTAVCPVRTGGRLCACYLSWRCGSVCDHVRRTDLIAENPAVRCADDRAGRFYAEKYHDRITGAGIRYRIYFGK